VDVVRLIRLAAVFGIPLSEMVDLERPPRPAGWDSER
jgi:hypothetical protein